ncbi:MAG: CotH kinase family protein [Bacteroidia bacterium]|nr:CotH kinase family protein [Bacteroidia bacterium]
MRALLLFLFPATLFAQTFNGTGGPSSDDGNNNDFILTVTGLNPAILNNSFGLVGACLTMTHTWDADMDVKLIAPDGTQIQLFTGVGGSGDNFTNTCFSQTASTSIASGNPPFTGTYKPMGNLGDANNGQNGNGNWILRCVDTYQQDLGNLISWSITFGNNPPLPFSFSHSNLPIVVINTNNQTIPNEPKISAYMGIIYNGPNQINSMSDPHNHYAGDIGIERRGAYSNSLPQKPYNIETRTSTGLNLDTALLGMPAEHDWCLIANYNDKAFVRNTLAYKCFREMGHYAPRSEFVEVVLNGQYQGIYLLMEKIKRDNNRVDIARLDSFENTLPNVSGGYILKNDYWDASNSWLLNYNPIDHPTLPVHLVYYYPKPDDITAQQKTYIQGFINQYESVLYGPNFNHPVNGYSQYLSINSWIDYFIVNELARNVDGFKKSWYMHKDMDGVSPSKLKAGPVWDFDWAWKNIWDCNIFQQTNGSGWSHHINDCNPDVNSNGWYIRLLQDTLFKNKLKCRWTNHRMTMLDTSYLFSYIDSIALYLDSAQQRHYSKWGHLGLNSGAPEIGPIPTTFQGEVDALKNWIRLRITWLDNNMFGTLYGCSLIGIPEEVSGTGWSIYPNPASGIIYISSDTAEDSGAFTITDVSGREWMRIQPGGGELTFAVSLSHLPSGMYFVNYGTRPVKRLVKI